MSGLALHRKLREEDDLIPVIFLTNDDDVKTAVTAMRGGAFDYRQVPVSEPYLLGRVHAALQQNRRDRQRAAERRAAAARFQELSPKEREVLNLMMESRRRKDIARELGVTCKTVSLHRANIMRKAGADTIARLAHLYLAGGLHNDQLSRGTMRTDEPSGGTLGKCSRNRSKPWTLLTACRGT